MYEHLAEHAPKAQQVDEQAYKDVMKEYYHKEIENATTFKPYIYS